MNTIPRAITAQFFPNSESYNALRHKWSSLVNSDRRHELNATHHLLYLALRGKNWRKAFTPLSSQRKLENGAFYNWGFWRVVNSLEFLSVSPEKLAKYPPEYQARIRATERDLLAPFDGIISPVTLQTLAGLLALPGLFAYKPEEFAVGKFPFDAYRVPKLTTKKEDAQRA